MTHTKLNFKELDSEHLLLNMSAYDVVNYLHKSAVADVYYTCPPCIVKKKDFVIENNKIVITL